MSLVGLAIIAKNEEETLPQLLESISGAFDRVVLLDTGSSDRTREVFVDWCMEEQEGNSDFTFAHSAFDWINDFAAARNAADDLLMQEPVEWRCWADCDDVIVGAQNARMILHNTPAQVTGLFAHYDYYREPGTGNCICALRRERFIRTSANMRWEGRVHEATAITSGAVQNIPQEVMHWRHCKDMAATADQSNLRNIEILTEWYSDEPMNGRVVAYLGTEHHSRNELNQALRYYEEYISLKPEWDQERAQVYRKYGKALIESGRYLEAKQAALTALGILPSWTDSYLTLAESSLALNDNDQAIFWAQAALNIGAPKETLLIINPLEYEYMPRKVLAGAFANLNQFDKAIAAAEDSLQYVRDEFLMQAVQKWGATRKRENTAGTICMMAEQLINHDEQMKALILLEQVVPHFAYDHPRVVQARSALRERISWMNEAADFAEHYENGGSKPEDFIKDEQIDELCAALPRTGFLLDNLSEYITTKINKELAA